MAGGQVSRVDPDSVGLNPAWRNSLIYTIVTTGWQEGANETQINTNRQQLIQDMKILEGIAPDSGAYLNEVRLPALTSARSSRLLTLLFFRVRPCTNRLPDTNSTGRNPFSVPTTINF